jgi:hypothetical protein
MQYKKLNLSLRQPSGEHKGAAPGIQERIAPGGFSLLRAALAR